MKRIIVCRTLLKAIGMLVFLFLLTVVPVRAETELSRTSATITVGDSVTLQCKVDGKVVSGATWGSSDSSVATVSNGKVTGRAKGSAVITAMYNGSTSECVISVVKKTTTGNTRYNVLIMDCSGSMAGTPMARAKTAAKRFAKAVLSADGTNFIALVSLNSDSRIELGFTDSLAKVNKVIGSLQSNGGTNMYTAFDNANTLLKSIPNDANVVKNVILCSDGLPKNGSTLATGKYVISDHKDYVFANAVYKLDTTMKSAGDFVYALGFFHNSTANDLVFGKRLMKDLASKDKYYAIENPDDIDTVFDDIAKQVTSITISPKSVSMFIGDTVKLTTYVNGIAKTVKWSSSDTSIATVNSNGMVTGKAIGTCRIRAVVEGKTVSRKVTVNKLTINRKTLTVNVDGSGVLIAYLNGISHKATWKSSNTSIASVSSSGKVVGRKAGTCTIYATIGGKTVSCNVTVKRPVTISVKPSTLTLLVGEKYVLKATVKGSKKAVTWSSGNKSICAVGSESGVVKGTKAGTTYVYAKIGSVSAKCKVTVKPTKRPVYSLFFNFDAARFDETGEWIDESGQRIGINEDGVIEKAAAYIEKKNGYYYVTIAFKGYKDTVTSATLYTYLAYKGKTVRDSSSYSRLNTISMRKDSDGIWSVYGSFGNIQKNIEDENGNLVVNAVAKSASKNVRIFTDFEKMKKYLKS